MAQKNLLREIRKNSGVLTVGDNFGNIGDAFPETEIKCRIRGCNNKIHLSGRESMNVAAGSMRSDRMCDECFAKLQTLEDKEMPCSKPGCKGTWIWNRFQQLEASAGGRTPKPHGFCKDCLEEMKNVQDRQIPCRIRGCKNTWTLTAREQLQLGDGHVPSRMCDECYHLLNTLQDQVLTCKIPGCNHTISWNRFQQLEYIRSGKSPDAVPSRMCDSCYALSKKLHNIEVPCRIRGCKNTWLFTVNEQMSQILAGKVKHAEEAAADEAAKEPAAVAEVAEATPVAEGTMPAPEVTPAENAPMAQTAETAAPKASDVPEAIPPSRMCSECYAFFSKAVDREEPCRNHSCKNTWTYTRSMQLAQKHYAQGRTPVRYCDECLKKLKELTEKQMPCSQKGCDGTWTYTPEEQLRDLSAGRESKTRRCKKCTDFLKSHPAVEIKCEKCGATVEISSSQQLECELGVSTMPTQCADCNKKMLSELLLQGPPEQTSSCVTDSGSSEA